MGYLLYKTNGYNNLHGQARLGVYARVTYTCHIAYLLLQISPSIE